MSTMYCIWRPLHYYTFVKVGVRYREAVCMKPNLMQDTDDQSYMHQELEFGISLCSIFSISRNDVKFREYNASI